MPATDILKRYWPPEDQLLLLEAALTDSESARAAWNRWLETRSLDTASWEEVRLLCAIVKRVREFDSRSPLLPRLEGIRKFVWSQTQICLNGTRPMLEALSQGHFRLMLLKGAARLARDPKSAAERLLRDVDILVHTDDWPDVLALAKQLGWRCPGWLRLKPKIFPYHHAVPVHNRRGFEIDLHHLALFMCRNKGDDDRIWERANRTTLQGLAYFAPSPTDELLLEIAHGFLYSGTPSKASDWVLDVAPLIGSNQIDWPIFIDEVRTRRLEVSAAAGLLLLRERLKLPVPDTVVEELVADVRDPFLSDFERSAVQYYPADKRQIECARAAACSRAIRNLRHQVPSTGAPGSSPRRALISSPPPLASILNLTALHLIGWMRLKVPRDLDPTDGIVLKFRVKASRKSRTRRGSLLIRAPGFPLKRFERLEPGVQELVFEVPAALFTLRLIRHVDIRLSGIPILNPIKVAGMGWIVRPSGELRGGSAGHTSKEQRERRLRRWEGASEDFAQGFDETV